MPIRSTLFVSVIASAALTACGGGGDGGGPGVPAPVPTGDTVALTASGRIATFQRAAPGTVVSSLPVLGLLAGENLLGIDYRPRSGALYAVSNQGRIYTIDPATGASTLRATLAADPADASSPFTTLAGTSFGLDFNPVADRLRLVSNTGQNLRINVDTGATTTDGAINGAAATIVASAYTNAFAGTTSTQLFNLDNTAGTLYLQDPPNDGGLAAPVPLGLSLGSNAGFDIDGRNNRAYAAFNMGATPSLYTLPLAAGGAAPALVGTIGTGEAIIGLALVPAANPTVLALTLDNQLVTFAPSAPNTFTRTVAISGLAAGERVLGIDFRPANGRLYGLTTAARLVTIDPDTGVASAPVALAADPTDATAPYAGLEASSSFVVDFNPVADRLRVVTDTGLNLRINVDTGVTITDGRINGATPVVVAGAYTNSFAGAAATALYDLDATNDVLALQAPPNDGTLAAVGPVGLDLAGQNAMDIAGGANGLVLAALRNGASGPFSLYTLSLATGAATLYANTTGDASHSFIGGATGPVVTDIAIRY